MNKLAKTYGDRSIMLGAIISKDNAYDHLFEWSKIIMRDFSVSGCIALGQIERELLDLGYLSIEQLDEIELKVNKVLEREEMNL